MAILSSIGKSIGGLIFTISLIALIASVGIAWLTTYDNIKPMALDIAITEFKNETNQTQLEQAQQYFLYECNRTGNQTQIPTGFQVPTGEDVTMNCSEIPTDPENLPEVIFGKVFDQIYYKEYDCWFPNCVRQALAEGPEDIMLLMITAKANSFFIELQTYAYIGIAIGLALVALSVRRPARIARTIGSSMVVTALVFLLMPLSQPLWPVPASLTNSMFAVMAPYVWSVLAVGVVLLAASIFMGIVGKPQKAAEAGKEKTKEKEQA